MSQITQPLPVPIQSGVAYDAIIVENPNYDIAGRKYTARVYGACRGMVMPLIINTPVQVHRIEDVEVTDEEIDTVLAEKPELNGDRVAGALARSFQRLYTLTQETVNA